MKRHLFRLACALPLLALASAAALAAAPAETLPSGVKVTHTVDGSGASPKATDSVKVHYRGTLANGVEFDSSLKRGQVVTVTVLEVRDGGLEVQAGDDGATGFIKRSDLGRDPGGGQRRLLHLFGPPMSSTGMFAPPFFE